ncbi:nitroreductase family protein [Yunchengibacter salinarum]|uniref:nitroreductase family protein n=1 Tax=Yunchengibacter salinarum TaxID=3133399 RepID=UPI0035B5CEAD
MTEGQFKPLSGYPHLSDDDALARVQAFRDSMATRRTVRDFSDRPVPRAVIEAAIETAASAPSGANKQPWHFAAVESAALKARLRPAVEQAEQTFYTEKASAQWLADLAPLGTDASKPFVTRAPWLIAVFRKAYDIRPDGTRDQHYYVSESVGIACGFLLAALHQAGLATLTHTPAPMGFLRRMFDRPAQEKPVMLVVTGHPAADARVPDITRKPLGVVADFHTD